jgi:hypothetical protein
MSTLRDFIYLDPDRTRSLHAQLHPGQSSSVPTPDRPALEQLFLQIEPNLLSREAALQITPDFDFATWTPETFTDARLIRATGVVRLLDFHWLTLALGGLPAVLKKMSKLEMDALRNSDEGKRMSKQALQQRSQENQVAIAKVEEFKADELGAVVRQLYGDVVRVKLRPNPDKQPNAALVGAAYTQYFHDSPAALSQKYGVEIDAGWTIVGQINSAGPAGAAPASPVPTGNKMEDSFEQIALLMNNAFRMAQAPAFPAISFTPIAIYRSLQ